uniref:Methyltranfer_dom domain-containing protein n=1 Tax=Heterorhabditis bacteriophora TaxID=37862 RepID=A0A1I7XDR1_HETBA
MSTAEKLEIASSKLGTKEYWDSLYETEFNNYNEYGDEGEVWFGKSAENRIVRYLTDSKVEKTAPILDLGCGNGSVLRKLREVGYLSLAGVDYCKSAVDLATKLAMEDAADVEISYEMFDILSPSKGRLSNQYKIVLDKGTWDAISLSDDRG